MKLLKIAPLVLIAALGGCESWDHLTSYVGLGGEETAPPPAERAPPPNPTPSVPAEQYRPWTPVGASETSPATPAPPAVAAPSPTQQAGAAPTPAAQPAPQSSPVAADAFCQSVAQSASKEAANQGFDADTQRTRALTAYNQCLRYGH